MMPVVALVVVACLAYSGYLWHRTSSKGRENLPPGPTPNLFVGNVHHFPSSSAWVYYTELGRKYGDVIHLSAFGISVIILNSYSAVHDLLKERSSMYSDRPRAVMAGELMSGTRSIPLASYGERWRLQRRLFHQYLGKAALRDYRQLLEKETRAFAGSVLNPAASSQQSDFFDGAYLLVSRLILGAAYGMKIDSINHEMLCLREQVSETLTNATSPSNYLVNIFPSLLKVPSWLPGTGWRRDALDGAKIALKMMQHPYEFAKQEIAAGINQPSCTSRMISDQDSNIHVSDELRMWTIGSMYGAGVDTTTTIVHRFILAMVLNPEVQRKGQEEIDRIIGESRLPNLDDMDSLPYIECIIKETFRWELAVPLALPHRLTKDDEYKGYRIPKGSIVIGNSWGISQDPSMYPEPEKFMPERFFALQNKTTEAHPLDPRSYAYGFGRRICPGVEYANQMIFMTVVSLLATTNILRPLDENGVECLPLIQFSGTTLRAQERFHCRFEPRTTTSLTMLTEATDLE